MFKYGKYFFFYYVPFIDQIVHNKIKLAWTTRSSLYFLFSFNTNREFGNFNFCKLGNFSKATTKFTHKYSLNGIRHLYNKVVIINIFGSAKKEKCTFSEPIKIMNKFLEKLWLLFKCKSYSKGICFSLQRWYFYKFYNFFRNDVYCSNLDV